MSRSEVRNKVTQLLSLPVKPICDKCIELALGYEFNTVNHINRELAAKGQIDRGNGRCCLCRDERLINAWICD